MKKLIFAFLIWGCAAAVWGQDTRASFNPPSGPKFKHGGHRHGHRAPVGDCFADEKVWIAGHWDFDRSCGRKRWVAGYWDVRRVAVACPPPACPPPARGGRCGYPTLSPAMFHDAMQSIQARSFESSKLTMARQIIETNCLTAAQVRDVMLLFSFESSKLDIAKFAYTRTVDPNMYFMVNEVFAYSASVQDLDNYIRYVNGG